MQKVIMTQVCNLIPSQFMNYNKDNKLVKINEEHRGINIKSHDVKVIASMDYWEDNAARVIQKNFLICRYNPKYAFCRKILNRQFDEYMDGISE